MSRVFFIQNSRAGRAIFELTACDLTISTRFVGRRQETTTELRCLQAEPRRRSVRMTGVLIFCGAIAVLSVMVLRLVWIAPEGLRGGLAFYPLLFLGVSLVTAIRYTPRLELIEFHDHWGRCKISIVRERHQQDECDTFIAALAARIALAQAEISSEQRRQLLREEAPAQLSGPGEARYSLNSKLSVILGLAATLLPPAPFVSTLLADMMLPIVVLCSTGSIACASLSILNKEKGRWLAVIGFFIGLLPVVFYS